MRILLVEPADDLGKVVARSLERIDMICDHATNAQSAIILADNHKPDAVVLELAMPAHNGAEFLYEFRSYTDWNNIPVIFYSQVSAEECGLNNEQLQQLGVVGHLYKPVTSLKTLQNTLLDVLHKLPMR